MRPHLRRRIAALGALSVLAASTIVFVAGPSAPAVAATTNSQPSTVTPSGGPANTTTSTAITIEPTWVPQTKLSGRYYSLGVDGKVYYLGRPVSSPAGVTFVNIDGGTSDLVAATTAFVTAQDSTGRLWSGTNEGALVQWPALPAGLTVRQLQGHFVLASDGTVYRYDTTSAVLRVVSPPGVTFQRISSRPAEAYAETILGISTNDEPYFQWFTPHGVVAPMLENVQSRLPSGVTAKDIVSGTAIIGSDGRAYYFSLTQSAPFSIVNTYLNLGPYLRVAGQDTAGTPWAGGSQPGGPYGGKWQTVVETGAGGTVRLSGPQAPTANTPPPGGGTAIDRCASATLMDDGRLFSGATLQTVPAGVPTPFFVGLSCGFEGFSNAMVTVALDSLGRIWRTGATMSLQLPSVDTVTFGSVASGSVTNKTALGATAVAPAQGAGTVDVVVTTKWPDGTLGPTYTIPRGFTYGATNFNVGFNANAADAAGSMGPQSFTDNAAQPLNANTYTRSGYQFTGWNTRPDGSGLQYADAAVATIRSPSTTYQLYAQWKPITYTVQFDANGGSGAMPDQSFVYGEPTALHSNTFTRPGFFFTGWKDDNGQDVADGAVGPNVSTTDASTVTLHAQWVSSAFLVHYESNAGVGWMADQSIPLAQSTALTANVYTKPGFAFAGWNTAADGTGTNYLDSESVQDLAASGAVVTLYARWVAASYLVQFDANAGAGSMAAQSVTRDIATALTSNAFTRTGFRFTGWNTAPDGSGRAFSDAATVTNLASNGASITLYAQWAVHSYTVNFNANGGTGSTPSQLIQTGATTPLTATGFTRTDNQFAGWNTLASGAGVDYAPGASVTDLAAPGQTITLYAKWTSDTWTVHFDSNYPGGPTVADQTIRRSGSSTTSLFSNKFTRPGYTFNGWHTNPLGTGGTDYANAANVSNTLQPANTTLNLYAKWTSLGSYTVTFNPQGGTPVLPTNQVILRGETVPLTANPFTNAGNVFMGWATASGSSVIAYRDQEPVKDLAAAAGIRQLYAVWAPATNVNTVHFDANGGTGTMPDQPINRTVATTLRASQMTRPGFAFAGWTEAADGSGTVYTDAQSVTGIGATAGPVTLHAKWTDLRYTVHYDANGGTGSTPDQTVLRGRPTALTMSGFSNPNGRFIGWSTQPTGGTVLADRTAVLDLVAAGATQTMYAQWAPNTYTIHFDANTGIGTQMADQPMQVGKVATTTLNAYTKPGFRFTGWNTAADGSGTKYEDGVSVGSLATPGATATLFAQWAPTTYSIAFNANGGAGAAMSNQTLGVDQAAALSTNTYTRAGYSFTGWATAADGTGTHYTDAQSVTNLAAAGASITLYATWELTEYRIAFEPNGGNLGMPRQVIPTTVSAPLATNWLTRTGYTFDEWNTAADKSGTAYRDGATVTDFAATGTSAPLFAQWNANTYDVVFNAGGGTGTMADQSFIYDAPATALTQHQFERVGYHFTGWNTTADGSGDSYTDQEAVRNLTAENNGNVELFAQWEANQYSVVFRSNGSPDSMPNQPFTYDAAPEALAANSLQRNGYTFAGWNTLADGQGTSFSNQQAVSNLTSVENGTVELFAQWTAKTYEVAFGPNGASNTMPNQTLTWDAPAPLSLNSLSRIGYQFTGWNSIAGGGGTAFTDGQVVANLPPTPSTYSVFAQWEANQYQVAFDSNGASGSMPNQSFTWDTSALLTTNSLTREGYDFAGWNTAADGSGVAFTDSQAVSNLTSVSGAVVRIYAQWRGHQYQVTFNPNGASGTQAPQTLVYGGGALNPEQFTKVGYRFTGWNTAADGSGAAYSDAQAVPNLTTTSGAIVELFGQWAPITYRVVFAPNGASNSMSDQQLTYDVSTPIAPNSLTRDGYTFTGWNTAADGSGASYPAGATLLNLTSTDGAAVTLYAQWVQVPGLAATGFDPSLIGLIGLGVLLAGLVLVVIARRRSKSQQ
ncbi:MAG TPA: InlB B-repeat-containing protein [Candidatus Lumbricidophila sp.]|nr:InlB B-repeat-containing protein [Candidatus Lumbricidophila sp.]